MRRRALRARSLARCSAVAFSLLRFDRWRSFSLSRADRSALGATASRARAAATTSSLGGVQTVDPAVSPSRLPGLLATISALSLSPVADRTMGGTREGENYRSSGAIIDLRAKAQARAPRVRAISRGHGRPGPGQGKDASVRCRIESGRLGSPRSWRAVGVRRPKGRGLPSLGTSQELRLRPVDLRLSLAPVSPIIRPRVVELNFPMARISPAFFGRAPKNCKSRREGTPACAAACLHCC